MKILKYSIYALLGVVALAIAGAVVFALTFDPNRYKDEIERLVRERTGRTLSLTGDLAVALWPSLGAKVGGATLSERGSSERFLAFESAHASVALMPLLRGEVVVDGIRLAGLDARVVRDKNGRFNFQDLLGEEKPAAGGKPAPQEGGGGAQVQFDIGGVSIERSSVSYRDLATGQQFAVSDLNVELGRIAEQAEGKLELSLRAKGNEPALDGTLRVASGYRFDLPARSFAVSALEARFNGTLGEDMIEARLWAPQLTVAGDTAKGEAVTAELHTKGGARSLDALLELTGVQGSAKALTVPQFAADLSMTDPSLPMKSVRIPVNGSLKADLEKQTAEADLKAKIDESNVQAKLALAKFSPPAYRFDVDIDRLDLDRYFPPAEKAAAGPSGAQKGGQKPAAAAGETPVDLSALKGVDARGSLRVGALQARGLKLAKVKAEVRAANGRAEVAPHSAELYGGSLAGAITAQAEGNRVAVKEKLSGISIGPLLRDFAQQDRLEGTGNLALDVAAAGATVEAMKKALSGSARVELKNGAIKGINIGQVLRKARARLSGEQTEAASQTEKTDFSELTASFAIRNGVAHNEDLDVKAPLFRINGSGDIDIPASRIDYTTRVAVVATAKGQGGAELEELRGVTVPVSLTGPFDNLSYKVNYGAVAADLAKSRAGAKIKEKVEERREEIKERLGDRLKGLLGR